MLDLSDDPTAELVPWLPSFESNLNTLAENEMVKICRAYQRKGSSGGDSGVE